MIMTPDERDEFDAMLTEAWSKSSSAPMVAADLERLLNDAVQSQRDWAKHVLADALDAGLQKLAKGWRKKQLDTDKGPIATTVGVMGAAGHYEQLELAACTPNQLREKLKEREKNLKAASRNAAALRKFIAVCDKHPKAKTLGAALRAEGITLVEVLAA